MRGAAAVTILCLWAASAFGAAPADLVVARSALRDGLWSLARQYAANVTNDEGRLVVLESYAGENRWDAIKSSLDKWTTRQGPAFDYYRAVVRGDHEAALKLLKSGGSPAGYVEAQLYEASVLARTNQLAAAQSIWREIAAATNVSDRALALAGIGLKDEALLRRAYQSKKLDAKLRRRTGLSLGRVLVLKPETRSEGFKLVRAIVADSPDAEGASEAFWALVEADMHKSDWQAAEALIKEYAEIWPEQARQCEVYECRGWVSVELGRREEALAFFQRAVEVATDDESRSRSAIKVGDVLAELGRNSEALEQYRAVIAKYAATASAQQLKQVIEIREQEAEGRRLYHEFKFVEARQAFERVAQADPAREERMGYYRMLCLYGQGLDDEALRAAEALSASAKNLPVRSEVTLWLAKFHYNRREWKAATRGFEAYANSPVATSAPMALLWAARAALADGDNLASIKFSSRLAERFPDSELVSEALIVQSEALVESARFDEAVLVLDRVMVITGLSAAVRLRAQRLKADALYMLGADNVSCYQSALAAYRAIRLGGALSPSAEVVISFKIARTLEKLKRLDEAIEQYYVQVVLAYRAARERHQRLDDDARAAFAKAAFRLADEYESRGKDAQAIAVLRLVAFSDVPAATEAQRRLQRLLDKGRIL